MSRGLLAMLLLAHTTVAPAQTINPPPTPSRARVAGLFLGGAAVAFGAHESGHLVFDLLFDADPGVGSVDFHGMPFFAIIHRSGLSPKREFTISSAGFWVQHGGSEWVLTRRPNLRREHAPFAKGVLAFNVLTSMAYAGAALARTGPFERDTRGIAASSRVDERWVGAMLLVPAAFDTCRYFAPDQKWAVWVSRAAKVGMVLLIAKD
ncbi:MAG: hypothetical protein ABIX28_11885 [Vicinamibacterales bacterium]